ncbi:hypothetical protein [Mesobacillus subterraneus]|uniref:Uncharacterized protein n=1 Tax=Mesobacillus subterraneus TaxID=285983 RepID=A0A3R9FS30_9BACI|nr:hypothetical protein [Mesobacillus subterraneus]RSD22737.1 hypothetical protein EJA10_20885 [Mesobacillus subterraneus]
MELLFELFSNPIALFILIGVISSLFNKKKEERQPQRRPVRPPGPAQPPGTARPPGPAPSRTRPAEARTEPQTGRGRGSEYEEERDVFGGSRRRHEPVEPAPVNSGNEVLSDLQKIYQERKRQAEAPQQTRSDKGRMAADEAVSRLRQRREEKQKQPEVVFQPDKEKLIEGLIWAEVLGKPRAKKPYNPVKR